MRNALSINERVPAMPELLTMNEVSNLVRLSRAQIAILIREESFPAPIRLSAKRLAFERAAVEAWINDKIEDRDRS